LNPSISSTKLIKFSYLDNSSELTSLLVKDDEFTFVSFAFTSLDSISFEHATKTVVAKIKAIVQILKIVIFFIILNKIYSI